MNYDEINLREVERFYCPFDTYHQYATIEKGMDLLSSGVLSVVYLDYEDAKRVGESMQIPDYDANVLCIKKEGDNYSISTIWYPSNAIVVAKDLIEQYIDKFKVVSTKSQVMKRIL